MDYQYGLSSWVYRILQTADREFSDFLHNTGYGDENKSFKFFTLSELNLFPFRVWKEQRLFELKSNAFSVQISFLIDRAYEEFVKGLFMHQEGFIGNRFNGIDFKVSGIEVLPPPVFQPTMRYKTLSPVFLSAKEGNRIIHLHPEEHEALYARCFLKNLKEKQKILQLHQPEDISDFDSSEWNFHLLKTRGTRLIRIKPLTPQETKNRACHMDFELTAPPEIHELAYDAGFGSENSWGCGMGEVMEE